MSHLPPFKGAIATSVLTSFAGDLSRTGPALPTVVTSSLVSPPTGSPSPSLLFPGGSPPKLTTCNHVFFGLCFQGDPNEDRLSVSGYPVASSNHSWC